MPSHSTGEPSTSANSNYESTRTPSSWNGGGTVFKITPTGTLTTLYSFCSQTNCADGSEPFAGLVQGTDGNFYGTTWSGGSGGYGTVFKVTTGGTLTTLYSFCSQTNCADGSGPAAELVQATNGTFYGTTILGGANGGGTVFKITPTGTLTTLYSFCSQTNCADGGEPYAGLVQATDGKLYGTTLDGGGKNAGTVFKITPSGTLTTLHKFGGGSGRSPFGGLVQDTNGTFYGTTGGHGLGEVFSLSVGLGPFVETLPGSGRAGAAVKILGTKLKGATAVSFNGTPATFTVLSNTEIKTTVPSGSTTGFVTVTTIGGNLKSNKKFRVTQ